MSRSPPPTLRSQIGPVSRAQISQWVTLRKEIFFCGIATPARASAARNFCCCCERGSTNTLTCTCECSAFAISACTAVGVSGYVSRDGSTDVSSVASSRMESMRSV